MTRTTPSSAQADSKSEEAGNDNGTKVRVSLFGSLVSEKKFLKSDFTQLDEAYDGGGFTLTQAKPSVEISLPEVVLEALRQDGSIRVEPLE